MVPISLRGQARYLRRRRRRDESFDPEAKPDKVLLDGSLELFLLSRILDCDLSRFDPLLEAPGIALSSDCRHQAEFWKRPVWSPEVNLHPRSEPGNFHPVETSELRAFDVRAWTL